MFNAVVQVAAVQLQLGFTGTAAGTPAAALVRQSSSWTAAICTTALSISRAA